MTSLTLMRLDVEMQKEANPAPSKRFVFAVNDFEQITELLLAFWRRRVRFERREMSGAFVLCLSVDFSV